ncbi:MAG: CBS domain-containing protein [Chloroflexi bacterium]|nr:CBS domain-containing protein [Chloroflexota bacterium]MCC6891533.1 CBS domain-containing protein [Anaerolineae bacterium]
MTKVNQVMTENPTCCLASDSIGAVVQQMQMHDVGAVPVVSDITSRKLIGIVTDRDIALRVVGAGRDSKGTWVADVMTPNPVACHDTDSIDTAIEAMSLHKVRRIPVVNDDRKLVGIVSQADVATRLGNTEKTAEVVEEISKPNAVVLPR